MGASTGVGDSTGVGAVRLRLLGSGEDDSRRCAARNSESDLVPGIPRVRLAFDQPELGSGDETVELVGAAAEAAAGDATGAAASSLLLLCTEAAGASGLAGGSGVAAGAGLVGTRVGAAAAGEDSGECGGAGCEAEGC